MKIDAIQFNNGIFCNSVNNKSKNTSFRAVYTRPYSETLKVIRYNIDKNGMYILSDMTHHLEWSKKWDMQVYGYMGKFHFEAWPKGNPKEPVLDVLNIQPLKKQSDEIDKEFEICAITYNHTDNTDRPFSNKEYFKLVFNDSNTAKQAYDTLLRNYQVFDKTLWLKTRKSNFERIRMAEENFKILEKSKIINV